MLFGPNGKVIFAFYLSGEFQFSFKQDKLIDVIN